MWRRKVTGATVLFMLNKYLLLLRFLIVLTSYDITTTEVRPLCRLVLAEQRCSLPIVCCSLPDRRGE